MITITPRTRFGLDGTVATSSQFQPGGDVVILGAVSKESVTADWVVAVRSHRSGASATR
jgi:hypothetical protein